MIIDPYNWRAAKIVAIEPVAADTVAVHITRPASFVFRAGQYAVVKTTFQNGDQRLRQYSFSSPPQAEDHLEMIVQREPGGEVSSWFCKQAKIGDEIELSQALGGFVLNDMTRPTVLIAGKVGVAPYLSMLREGSHPALSLIYSVRSENQVCYPEELKRYNAGVLQTGKSGRLASDSFVPFISSNPVFYVCGSKQFVDAIGEMLASSGVLPINIYRELFTLQ